MKSPRVTIDNDSNVSIEGNFEFIIEDGVFMTNNHETVVKKISFGHPYEMKQIPQVVDKKSIINEILAEQLKQDYLKLIQ